MTPAEEIFAIFRARGAGAYFGEHVSMSEHALQAACFAQAEGASPALIVAALLHDIGHLIEAVPADIADWTTDAGHERVGGRWLAQRFAPEVFEPVRLHVPAKRYLCATDGGYFAKLSEASVATLKLQGGPMSAAEAARFEGEPFNQEAVRLRRWDDQGKVAGLPTPEFEHYRSMIDRLSVGGC
ncbi:MAG: phosphonate degradation HD-domain oxygenase [Steroidobacteraceae bacterium]